MNIAIVPARGGSKRIPGKNVKAFCGRPMIAWPIAAAVESRLFDRILVSTDDAEIARIANDCGATVPFKRPPELSNDYAGTTEVIAHAVDWAQKQGWKLDGVCCIYATAPFVCKEDLQRGEAALRSGPWAYAFSVTDFAAPIFRGFRRLESGGVEMFFPEHFSTRSQDLPQAFHDAGQFYWGTPDAWLAQARLFDHHSFPVMIPRWRVQDIDTIEDWRRAELLAALILAKSDRTTAVQS